TTSSDVNVLSTPHILTTDNEEAEITVGQNVPFQAGYAPQGLANLLTGTTGTTGTGALGGLLGSSIGAFGLSSLYAPIQRQNVELKLKRSEERRVGKECRSRWSADRYRNIDEIE